jgi:AcrR family transcriptional regulator
MSALPGTKRERTSSALLVAVQELLLDEPQEPLTITRIAAAAGVVQGTFYNYFDSVDEALDSLATLLVAEHTRLVDAATSDITDAAEVFAITTRQTLHFVATEPGYGRLLFDSRLPVDQFTGGLRARMQADLLVGIQQDRFRVDDLATTVAILAGSVLGVAIGLHRGHLGAHAINGATESLLRTLGVPSWTAHRLATDPRIFMAPSPVPLSSLIPMRPV